MTEDYQAQNDDMNKTLKDIGRLIKQSLPKSWGFTLLLFDYGDTGSLFYLSSAQREDIINLLYEFISVLKKNN